MLHYEVITAATLQYPIHGCLLQITQTIYLKQVPVPPFHDNVPDGRIFDGYVMAALFCGLGILSGFMNNMICIGGCLTMLLFMIIKMAVSLAIGIFALPICITVNLYRIVKNGRTLVNSSIMN